MSGKNKVNKLKKQAELRKITQKAQEFFADKSFAEQFKPLKQACSVALPPLSVLSMLNAMGYFVAPATPTVGIVGAIMIALVLTALIEAGKALLFWLSVVGFYKNGVSFLSGLFFAGFLAVLAGSVYTSILGAKQLTKDFDQSQTRQEHQTDSLRTHQKQAFGKQQEEAIKQRDKRLAEVKNDYTKRIASEQQGLADYKASVSHKGQINIYNPTNAKTITDYQDRINQLQASLAKEIEYIKSDYAKQESKLQKKESEALQTLATQHQTATQKNSQNLDFSIWFWALISGVNEAAILFCAWFVIHYYYKVQQEPQDLGIKEEGNLFETIQNFLFMLNAGLAQDLPRLAPQDVHKQVVGFTSGKATGLASLATSPAASNGKQDLQGLYQAIARGEGHIPTLISTYRANIGHVNACKLLQGLTVSNADRVKQSAEYNKVKKVLGI